MRRMIRIIFTLLFLCNMTADAQAQKRPNFAYMSTDFKNLTAAVR
jgi:hypothetical protein